jgi:regulator of protease activity HflC (stomatin/prohibitin superfamily)
MDDQEFSKGKALLHSVGRITKKFGRAGLLVGLLSTPFIAGSSYIAKWTYQVRTNYGVVVTAWDGKREAVTDVGWHGRWPIVSTYEGEVPLANQIVFLNGNSEPQQVVTKNGTVIMASAATYLTIVDLKKYAIDNVQEETGLLDPGPGRTGKVNTRVMIQKTLDSIVGGHIQMSEPEVLIHNRETVEEKIKRAVEKSNLREMYGVKLNDFKFPVTNYVEGEVVARANKQATIVNAQARDTASESEKRALVKLGEAEADIYQNIRNTIKPKNSNDEKRVDQIFDKVLKYRTMKNKPGSMILMDGNGVAPVYNVK